MLDYNKLMNTLKVLADVYGEKEFTSKEYKSMAKTHENVYQAKYSGMDVNQVVKLHELEAENRRL